jgi:2-iminoacetate synthase ThiH
MTSDAPEAPLVEGEDFYWEGAALVFTARYHLRRGYCCESGCRHCPYRAPNGKEKEAVAEKYDES